MKLEQLLKELEKLEAKAIELDKGRGENTLALFDSSLFSCSSKALLPCVQDAKKNLQALIKAKDQFDTLKAVHLCEKLLNQISALQRELGTTTLRRQEKRFIPKSKESIHDLHQSLAQHQAWERQLIANVKEAQWQLENCDNFMQRQQRQQRLLAAEKRVERCRKAKIQIENKIFQLEQKG